MCESCKGGGRLNMVVIEVISKTHSLLCPVLLPHLSDFFCLSVCNEWTLFYYHSYY